MNHTRQEFESMPESMFNAQNGDLETTEQVLEKLAEGLEDDYIFTATEKEILECAADLVKKKRGVQ